MSCPCGSTKCVCEKTCLCPEINCHCIKCQSLEKICSRCNLPSYVIILKKDCELQICSCDKQGAASYSEAQAELQAAASAMGDLSSVSPVRRDQCPRCSLPILILTEDDDYEGKVFYCCSSLKNLSTDNSDMSTEHETSTCTSDPREVSADRQVRKALSRTTREVPKWQAKKVNDRSFNSAEESSYTETVDSSENIENLNSNSNTQFQTGHTSRADATSTGNIRILVNTSRIASRSTPKSSSKDESLGFFQINRTIRNVRGILPNPFPRFPIPIPGPSAFGRHKGQFPNPPVNRPPRARHPFQSRQPRAARGQMIRCLLTPQDAMNTRELPEAGTAAALNKEDKERLKEELGDKASGQSEKQPEKKLVEQSKDSSNSGKVPAFKSPVNAQKSGKDDIDPTTDT